MKTLRAVGWLLLGMLLLSQGAARAQGFSYTNPPPLQPQIPHIGVPKPPAPILTGPGTTGGAFSYTYAMIAYGHTAAGATAPTLMGATVTTPAGQVPLTNTTYITVTTQADLGAFQWDFLKLVNGTWKSICLGVAATNLDGSGSVCTDQGQTPLAYNLPNSNTTADLIAEDATIANLRPSGGGGGALPINQLPNQTGNYNAQDFAFNNVSDLAFAGTPFASLPPEVDGTIGYCSNCQATNPCQAGGTGAFVQGSGGQWNCAASNPLSPAATGDIAYYSGSATVAGAAGTAHSPWLYENGNPPNTANAPSQGTVFGGTGTSTDPQFLTVGGDASASQSGSNLTLTVTKLNGVTPGGACSGSTPFVASLSSQAVPSCMGTTTSPSFRGFTLLGSSSGSVTVETASSAGSGTNFQLPNTNGTTGQFLETDGTGVTSWGTPSGAGTVNAGTAGQMTYYASSGTAVSGNANATISSGALTLGQAASVQGSLKLSGATANALTLTAPASITTYTLTLPGAAPAQGAFLYASNGTGTLSSLTAGSSGQILVGSSTSTVPAWDTMSQDCTLSSSAVITCLKTNNVAFTFFATLANLTGDTTTSGSGVTTTAKVDGVAYPASPSVDQIPIVTSTNQITYKTIPNCPTSGGTQALNYTQSPTSAFSCNAVSGGGGGGSVITYGPTTINGTTAGHAYCSEVVTGSPVAQIVVQCVLAGYENTSGTTQPYNYGSNQAFTYSDAFGPNTLPPCGNVVSGSQSLTTLNLPINMTNPETGVCELVGL